MAQTGVETVVCDQHDEEGSPVNPEDQCGHCQQSGLKRHCPSHTCTWQKCTVCSAVIAKDRHYHKDDQNGLCAGKSRA